MKYPNYKEALATEVSLLVATMRDLIKENWSVNRTMVALSLIVPENPNLSRMFLNALRQVMRDQQNTFQISQDDYRFFCGQSGQTIVKLRHNYMSTGGPIDDIEMRFDLHDEPGHIFPTARPLLTWAEISELSPVEIGVVIMVRSRTPGVVFSDRQVTVEQYYGIGVEKTKELLQRYLAELETYFSRQGTVVIDN